MLSVIVESLYCTLYINNMGIKIKSLIKKIFKKILHALRENKIWVLWKRRDKTIEYIGGEKKNKGFRAA